MGIQENGLRMILGELVTLQVTAVTHRDVWRHNKLQGFLVTCPQLDYRRLWFTHDGEWQHIDYPFDVGTGNTLWMIPSGVDRGAVIYAVGVAIVGDLLSTAVDGMRDDPGQAPVLGVYVRECEIFLQRSIRSLVTGGYAHEAYLQADLELKRHLGAIADLAGYDGIFGVTGTDMSSSLLQAPVTTATRSTDDAGSVGAPGATSSSRYSRAERTSLLQFTNAMKNQIARRALGIEMSDAEGARIADDPALARAYYHNWTADGDRLETTASSTSGGLGPRRNSAPVVQVPGRRTSMSTRQPTAAATPKPHSRMQAAIGFVLGLVAYLLAGGWLSPLVAIAGLAVCIPAILSARAARGRPYATVALTIAIIGTVVAAVALILGLLYLSR